MNKPFPHGSLLAPEETFTPSIAGFESDTISANLDKQPKHDELGLIRASCEVFKGEGELVLYCEYIQTLKDHDGKPQA